ncbi:MAG: tRNA uridine-5-carboxymethylaminomethyl(34) synthesis enzyme MnmG, partial [Opitutae bacterium]|nr:tRNA uridine-5-carboxymethylaminomethyl(34) synthesis enzyme MnmG [Opitutae bacterium]
LLTNNRLDNNSVKISAVESWRNYLENTKAGGGTWAELIRRSDTTSELPGDFLRQSKEVREEVLYQVRYRGYLEREQRQIEKLKDVEKVKIPSSLDYLQIPGLRRESAQKLHQFKPQNLGQASRISGVNPADISILMVLIAAGNRSRSTSSDPG